MNTYADPEYLAALGRLFSLRSPFLVTCEHCDCQFYRHLLSPAICPFCHKDLP